MAHYEVVTLTGPYLRGLRCVVTVDPAGYLIACNAIRCVWTGSRRFDAWFRDLYSPRYVAQTETASAHSRTARAYSISSGLGLSAHVP